MSFWNWVTRKRADHGWPGYIINGRIRTSTAGLILAFFVIAWLHSTYQPPAPTPAAPETAQVVPPGFMPDPEYTWVPRTNVETRPRTTTPSTTTPTTTTTTTEPSPTETTSSTDTTSATTTSDTAPTNVIDPDGAGPLPPITLPPGLPVPNRSGTTTTTTVLPGEVPAPTALPPPG
ncbi:MAG: hypothetical protein QOI01_457 [Mycobacterium sp.]|jgi:cytoskeletal protein RodZ|nr:hypothetical protein [Mycobacterium sp.]